MFFDESKNIDYINMYLKRLASEDEINVVTDFWKGILPYRYFKGFYKKVSKKFFFTNSDIKKLKIKGHRLLVKSASLYSDEKSTKEIKGDILKTVAALGLKPSSIEISTKYSNKLSTENIYNYAKKSFVPTTGIEAFSESETKTDIFALGLIKKRKIKKPKIKNGLNIVVIGDFTDVNNPFHFNADMQKKLSDVCLEILKNKLARACQTCECGVFSAMVKLLQKKKWGVFVSADNLHKTNNDFPAWQYLTSKNPERLIFAVRNSRLVRFINLIDKYDIPFSIIGKVDKSKHFRVMYKGKLIINLPKKLLFNPIIKINNFDFQPPHIEPFIPNNDNFEEKFYKIINSEQFKAQTLSTQVDKNLEWQTSFRLYETSELCFPKAKHYISSTINSNPIQITQYPYSAGKNLVCDGARRLVALGHKPVGISVICNINFSQKGEVKRFDEVRKGIIHSAKRLKIKILNVNIVNTLENSTYCVNIIGKRKLGEEKFLPFFDKERQEKVYIIGRLDNIPAISYYQREIGENISLYPDEVNMKFEKRLYKCVKKLQKKNLISGCSSVDKFGIFGAVMKAFKPRHTGFLWTKQNTDIKYLFNENSSRLLIYTDKDSEEIEKVLIKNKIPFELLGETNNTGQIEVLGLKINT